MINAFMHPIYIYIYKIFYNLAISISKYLYKSDLLLYVVKHDIMEKLINKCICVFENFPNHHILDKLDSHE